MTFTANTVYHQEFQNGDRCYFLVMSQFKNGRWNGYAWHNYSPRKAPVKHMGDPTVPGWMITPLAEIPAKLATLTVS